MLSDRLVEVALLELPETIAAIRFAHHEQFPHEDSPSDADVIAAILVAYQSIVDADLTG